MALKILQIIHTVEPPPTATSLQRPFFFWRAVHTLPFVSTSLQGPVFFFPQGGRCREVQLYLQDSVFMVVIMM